MNHLLRIAATIANRLMPSTTPPAPSDELTDDPIPYTLVEQAPTHEQLDAEEQREYHLAICEHVEDLAETRLAEVGMQDFTFWQLELPSRRDVS